MQDLPKSLKTLLNNLKKQLPLINFCKAKIPLKVKKLPTLGAREKHDRLKNKKKKYNIVKIKLYFFNLVSIM